MVVFIVLWPYLLTTKLRCLQKNNIGHTNIGVRRYPMSRSDCVREPYLTPHFAIRGDAQFVSLSDYWLSKYTCKVFRPNTANSHKVDHRGK